jgi:hypothetical protein
MKYLSAPSRALSSRILKKVPFENRFIGYRLSERHGACRITSYSFQEVVNLLKSEMPRVDFFALQEWVRKVMGDEELAEMIAAAAKAETNDHDRAVSARNLMEERLAQCERLV